MTEQKLYKPRKDSYMYSFDSQIGKLKGLSDFLSMRIDRQSKEEKLMDRESAKTYDRYLQIRSLLSENLRLVESAISHIDNIYTIHNPVMPENVLSDVNIEVDQPVKSDKHICNTESDIENVFIRLLNKYLGKEVVNEPIDRDIFTNSTQPVSSDRNDASSPSFNSIDNSSKQIKSANSNKSVNQKSSSNKKKKRAKRLWELDYNLSAESFLDLFDKNYKNPDGSYKILDSYFDIDVSDITEDYVRNNITNQDDFEEMIILFKQNRAFNRYLANRKQFLKNKKNAKKFEAYKGDKKVYVGDQVIYIDPSKLKFQKEGTIFTGDGKHEESDKPRTIPGGVILYPEFFKPAEVSGYIRNEDCPYNRAHSVGQMGDALERYVREQQIPKLKEFGKFLIRWYRSTISKAYRPKIHYNLEYYLDYMCHISMAFGYCLENGLESKFYEDMNSFLDRIEDVTDKSTDNYYYNFPCKQFDPQYMLKDEAVDERMNETGCSIINDLLIEYKVYPRHIIFRNRVAYLVDMYKRLSDKFVTSHDLSRSLQSSSKTYKEDATSLLDYGRNTETMSKLDESVMCKYYSHPIKSFNLISEPVLKLFQTAIKRNKQILCTA